MVIMFVSSLKREYYTLEGNLEIARLYWVCRRWKWTDHKAIKSAGGRKTQRTTNNVLKCYERRKGQQKQQKMQ